MKPEDSLILCNIHCQLHVAPQGCAHGNLLSTSSQSSWLMGTCWITCGSVTGRRWMLWCCCTWQLRSPQPWSTWRRKTSSTGRKDKWAPLNLQHRAILDVFSSLSGYHSVDWCHIFNTLVQIWHSLLTCPKDGFSLRVFFLLPLKVAAGERHISTYIFWAKP